MGVGEQTQHPPAFANVYVFRQANGRDDGAHDRRAGAIATHPGYAGARVGGLKALLEGAVVMAIERRAKGCQYTHCSRALTGQDPDRVRHAQSRACRQRVLGMEDRIIVLAKRCGHAALRPTGRTALPQRRGGQNHDGSRRG